MAFLISIRLLGYGERVNTLRDVEESVTMYATRATDKLQSQASTCDAVNVFVETERFKLDEPQYQNGRTIPLPDQTDDFRIITKAHCFQAACLR